MARTIITRIVIDEYGMPIKVTVQKPGSGVFREVPTGYVDGGLVGWVLHEEQYGFDLKMYYDINTDIDEEDQ